MRVHPLLLLSLVLLIVGALVVPAAAQAPLPAAARPLPPNSGRGPGLQQDRNGLWFMPADAAAAATAGAAPQNSGGPDDFGYTWNDAGLNWIDASGGTDTGINSDRVSAGPFDVGFPFKFYENTRAQVYVSRYGYLAFNGDNLWNSQSRIPSAEKPDDVVAPHWVPNYDGLNYVRYLRGGAAPNRWFAVEWNQLRSSGNNTYTFEAVLYENGSIVFQYKDMTTQPGYCQDSGIEDSTGLDGLSITGFCNDVAPNHAVRITRPAPAARVNLLPRGQGSFGAAGAAVSFNQTVRNTGELGVDTYDLYVESPWPTTLYHADGASPLTDTDGDGQPDTGPVDQGSSKTITIKTQLPADAAVGASNTAQVTAISSRNPTKQKTARLQAAVPASFAASYSQSGKTKIGTYRPGQQSTTQPTDADGWGYSAAAATMPDGRIVQAWVQGRNIGNNRYVNEIYYALIDNRGNVLRPAARLADLGSASTSAYDQRPALAVTPDGHIGVAWYRDLWDGNAGKDNYNIYFAILNSSGDVAVPPTNVTNNGGWGQWNDPTAPQLFDPTIAATQNNRFGIAWTRYTSDGSQSADTIWYGVRSADGSEVRGPAQFSDNTRSWNPNLTPLADGTLFLAVNTIGNLGYGRIDSAGNVASPLVTVLGPTVYPDPDAVQLPNGNIVVAWADRSVQYVVLNSALQIVQSITSLPAMSAISDYNASVTASGNRAVLTWGDGCCGYQPNLYYALLDGTGNVVTPPMIFFSDYANYDVELPYNGQGATPLIGDSTPPANPTGLTSPSHAVNTWSKDNTVDLTWTAAVDDDSGVAGYSILWDQKANSVPDTTKDIGPVTAATSPALADGAWYAHLRAVDVAGNWAQGAAHLGPFKIDTTPPQSRADSPAHAIGAIPVTWWGTDGGSGIASYDVWVKRDKLPEAGAWTKWLSSTTDTSAEFVGATIGERVFFQAIATDRLGNIEQDALMGDSMTIVSAKVIIGSVTNVREEPIFNARVVATRVAPPGPLVGAFSDARGEFAAYTLTTEGAFNLYGEHSGYGELPVMKNLDLETTTQPIDLVLPPRPDKLGNGGFETGVAAWTFAGSPTSPTVEGVAARTGDAGLRLGSAAWQSVTQTITVPADASRPTLSLYFRVTTPSPDGYLHIEARGSAPSRTVIYPLTERGWTHEWLPLDEFVGQEVTIVIAAESPALPWEVDIDEVSVGDAVKGSYPIFAPVLRR